MDEIDLKELFNLFISKIFEVILIVIIAAVIGGIYTMFFTVPKYSSSTKLVLTGSEDINSNNSITTTDITLNSKLVATYGELVKSNSVLRQVISNLNIDIEESLLRKNISVKSVEDTEVIEITVTNENSEYSAKIANEIAIVFCNKVTELYGINNIRILDTAEVQEEPSNINHTKDIIIFMMAGIILACGYILVLNMFDTTIKSIDDIEKDLNVTVLVSIPQIESFDSTKGGKKK